MDLSLLLSVAVGLVTGVIVALKVIAPKTKNTVDDAVLARLEALEAMLKK